MYVSPEIVNVSNVNVNDIIVVVRNGSRQLIGKHARVIKEMPNTVIGAFMTGVRTKNSKFINALFDGDVFQKEIHKNLGATINQITIKSFKEMKFFIPKDNEQKIVGDLISKVDKLLALQQRKLEKLFLIKKAISDKVFNDKVKDENSVFFKNRIKGKNLFKLSNKKGHPELPVLSATQDKGMVPRNSINKNIQYNNVNLDNYKVIVPGDFVIHLRSFQGGFAYSNIKGIASPAYNIFKFKDGIQYNSSFWKEKFKSYSFIQLLKKVTYGIRDGRSISFTDFSTLYLNFPDINIQNTIGDLFDDINKQIKIQQKIISNLCLIKNFLLQNMFI